MISLNGNVNSILYILTHNNITPVMKRSDGLYTLVDKSSITPSDNPGTNLNASYPNYDMIKSPIPEYENIAILGNWSTSNYWYNSDNNKWTFIQGPPQ